MKKTLLLAAAWFLSVAASAQTDTYIEYGYIDGTPQASTALENNELYFIYDNFSGRQAFRYVNSDGRVCGTSGSPTIGQEFGDAYVWKAIQVEGGWQFQNLQNSKYIPAVTTGGNNIITSETGGTYVLTARNNTSDNFAVTIQSGDNTFYWDGTDGTNPVMAIGNWDGTPDNPHIYQFYRVKDFTKRDYTITFVKDNVTYGTAVIDLHDDLQIEQVYPTELGTMGAIENNASTFTFAEDVAPFKMVNSRRLNQWMTTNDKGLYRTSSAQGSFDAGEWFIQQNVTGGFKIFAPSKGKYVGTFTDGVQIPLVLDSANASVMTLQTNQNGPSVIISNNLGMNLWTGSDGVGTINAHGYMSNGFPDASCYWFLVYDKATYDSNIANYYVAGSDDQQIPVNNSNARFLNTGTWYVAQQAAKDAIAAAVAVGIDENEVAKVQELVDAAAVAQFGKAGTDITAMVTSLNEGAATLNAAVDALVDLTLTIKKGDVVLATYTCKGKFPEVPESLGTIGETVDDAATLTINDSNMAFKMVCARYSGVWGTTDDAGLYHTANSAGSYAAGEYFVMVGDEESFNFFSPAKMAFIGTFASGAQAPFSTTPATFTIEHSQNGPVAIKCTDGAYMNDHGGNSAGVIGGWSAGTDSGSYWFIVEDEETYNTNKEFYWKSDGTAYIDGYGNFTNNNPWYEAVQSAKNAITAADEAQVPDSYKEDLQALVNQAMTVNFGQKGVSIAKMIDDLTSGATTLNQVALGIDEVSIVGGTGRVVYDLQGRRLAAPVKGINIINGKKVLVK